MSDVAFGLLQQHEDLRRVALSMLAKGGLSVVSIALVLSLGGGLFLATLVMALAWGAWLVAYDLPAARRFAVVRPLLEPRMLVRLAWLALPMGLVAGLQSLMTNVPRYAIEANGGTTALGYFAGIAYLDSGRQPAGDGGVGRREPASGAALRRAIAARIGGSRVASSRWRSAWAR